MDLQQTWPDFLDLLDSDRDKAAKDFYEFVKLLINTAPPQSIRSLSEADRKEFIQQFMSAATENNFRMLHMYENRQQPFAAWLTVITAAAQALRLRKSWPRSHAFARLEYFLSAPLKRRGGFSDDSASVILSYL